MRHLVLISAFLAIAGAAHAQPAASPGRAAIAAARPALIRPTPQPIRFKAEVPKAPDGMAVLRLTAQPAPVSLVNTVLAASRAPAKLAPLASSPLFRENKLQAPDDALGVVVDQHVRAWVDPKTGDAEIYPELGSLQPLAGGAAPGLGRVADLFKSRAFLAADDTRVVVDRPQTLYGATYVRDRGAGTRAERPKAAYLSYVAARRFVGEVPVTGRGSRAQVALGAGGSVEGLIRSWKSAKTVATIQRPRGPGQVLLEIERQLRPSAIAAEVTVETIDLVYYDGNEDWLQPAYRFTARLHRPGSGVGADDLVIGYVSVGELLEPLPVLGQTRGPSPTRAAPRRPGPPISKALQAASAIPDNDPIVGRYVVREDDTNWVADANEFWGGLTSTWWSAPLFTNSQYYWAEPRLFTTQKNWFINAMHLALIEVHGDWWLYSTLKNCCDLVDITSDIPSPGYGPSAGGRLADWVIHSCEVVPAPDDTSTWADPWWNIFGGVRNVVGYRTIMYIDDDAGWPYGSSLGRLAPVVSSWLSDVISLGAYSGHPHTPAHGGVDRPMGRPSTISACGHDGDSVLSTSTLGRAGCLTVWWFPD